MGIVHGVSNLGGSILSVAARAKFVDKKEVRAFIAFCYLCFILVQIGVLVLSGLFVFHLEVFLFPLVAGTIYLLIGKRIFNTVSEDAYRKVFSGFMLLYGIVLGIS